jgi:lysophospholipase L1-like esterase
LGIGVLSFVGHASATVQPMKMIAFGDSTTTHRGGTISGGGVTVANSGRPSTGTSTVGGNTDPNFFFTLDHDVSGPTGWLYTYGDILCDELGALIGSPVDVLNEGLSGNMSYDAVNRIGTDVLGRDADVVIMQFGINDSVFKNGQHNIALDAAEEATYNPFIYYKGNFVDNMTSVVQQAKAEGLRVIVMTPNHTPPPASGVDLTALPLYAQAVRDLAASESVELIDVYAMYDILENDTVVTDPALLEVLPSNYLALDPADLLVADLIHPNGLGQRMVAEALKQVLVPEPASGLVLSCLCLVAVRRRR